MIHQPFDGGWKADAPVDPPAVLVPLQFQLLQVFTFATRTSVKTVPKIT